MTFQNRLCQFSGHKLLKIVLLNPSTFTKSVSSQEIFDPLSAMLMSAACHMYTMDTMYSQAAKGLKHVLTSNNQFSNYSETNQHEMSWVAASETYPSLPPLAEESVLPRLSAVPLRYRWRLMSTAIFGQRQNINQIRSANNYPANNFSFKFFYKKFWLLAFGILYMDAFTKLTVPKPIYFPYRKWPKHSNSLTRKCNMSSNWFYSATGLRFKYFYIKIRLNQFSS